MTRNQAIQAMQANYQKRSKAWNLFCARQTALAKAAHPETGGHLGMVHNWGNDAAKAVIAAGDKRWAKISAAYDRRYNALLAAMSEAQ